jgi:hypothetical protein
MDVQVSEQDPLRGRSPAAWRATVDGAPRAILGGVVCDDDCGRPASAFNLAGRLVATATSERDQRRQEEGNPAKSNAAPCNGRGASLERPFEGKLDGAKQRLLPASRLQEKLLEGVVR